MKKIFIIPCIFIVLLTFPYNVKAAEFIENQAVNSNKSWTINFCEEVLFNDETKDHIKIEDINGNEVNSTMNLSEDSKAITITPEEGGYLPGESYTLNIGSKVHSKSGKELQKDIKFHFNIKNETEVISGIILKDTDKPLISTGAGDAPNNELWVKYSDGKEELLVASMDAEDVKDIIAGIFNPQLTQDKKKIYFMTEAWATSAAIHVVEIKSKNQQFVCSGNYLKIIEKGQYSGKLIVNQHRYYGAPNYGAYDNYYIVDENGKQIEDLGDDPAVLDEY
ncbi:Ig-like domain-containing protein [Clostridium tagluense]|uniref:Ig-like domain-containing protein n=1 Tax=Clostridium tagluense TaxID=360422 RepID=UPI001C0B72DC|nr:Ig-like domain-containing protein [Clostridium tagluense]MBU3130177.1 Ig-like domain-containing protein [Clostridium tagluense]